jgi:hypothetical protein
MPTCLNHPEVPTQLRCRVCGQFFCQACLEDYEAVGQVCAECERELDSLPTDEVLEHFAEIKARVIASLPPSRPWWGWELLFWALVAAPTVIAGMYLFQLFRYNQAVAILTREPLLPGILAARLTDVSKNIEAYWMDHQAYPESLEQLASGLKDSSSIVDPYSSEGKSLIYQHDGTAYRLCSRGPDRAGSRGVPLDRFSGVGDICIGTLDTAEPMTRGP